MFDDAGTVLTRIDGAVSAAWVDSNAFATATDCSDGASIGQVSLHRLGGGSAVLDGQFDTTDLVGNGHGAVALSQRSLESPQGKPSFVVWAGDRISRAVAGEPVAWSMDGSQLLVRASTAWGTPAAPQILSYPSLKLTTLSSSVLLGPLEMPVFSPDGRLIGLQCGIPSGVYYCTSMVLDAANGTERAVTPSQASGLPMSWLSNGRLLLQPQNQPLVGDFLEWNGARVVPSKLPAGAWAVASPDGRLVAIGTSPDPASGSTLVVTATGASVTRLPSTGGAYGWVTLRTVLPSDGRAMRRWLAAPEGPCPAALWFITDMRVTTAIKRRRVRAKSKATQAALSGGGSSANRVAPSPLDRSVARPKGTASP